MTGPRIAAGADRRTQSRSPQDNAATSVVQSLIRNPRDAVASIEADLESGGDPSVLLGLLDAAEAILAIRGVDRSAQLTALREKIGLRQGGK